MPTYAVFIAIAVATIVIGLVLGGVSETIFFFFILTIASR